MKRGLLIGLFVIIVIALSLMGIAWAQEPRMPEGEAVQCLDTPGVAMVSYRISSLGVIPRVVDILVKSAEGNAMLTTRVEVIKTTAVWRLQETLYRECLAGKALDTTLTDVSTGAAVTRNVFYLESILACGWLFPAK